MPCGGHRVADLEVKRAETLVGQRSQSAVEPWIARVHTVGTGDRIVLSDGLVEVTQGGVRLGEQPAAVPTQLPIRRSRGASKVLDGIFCTLFLECYQGERLLAMSPGANSLPSASESITARISRAECVSPANAYP